MFDSFFLGSLPDIALTYNSSYNVPMVIVSVLIAIFSSFCSLEMVDRLARGEQRYLWLSIGALILGGGVWAMHFIGMLAFHLDCEVSYDPWITGLSVLPGIFAAAVALNTVNTAHVDLNRLVLGGIVMATGIALMHYAGMAAIRLDGMLRYKPELFVASLAVAVYLSIAALLIKAFLYVLVGTANRSVSSLLGGCALGGAISSMHYIAMEAAYFIHDPAGDNPVVATSPNVLAVAIAFVAFLLIFSGLVFTYLGGKLAQVRVRINAVLDSTNQGFVMMDRDGVITECNSAMSVLTGMDKQLLIGKFYWDLMITDRNLSADTDQQLLAGTFYRDLMAPDHVRAKQGNRRAEVKLNRADGSLLPCLVDSNSIFDNESDEILYSFALFSDISQRIADETELREREMQFRALLESTPDPMVIVDGNDSINMINRQAVDLLGYAKDELLGKAVGILLTDESGRIYNQFRNDTNAQAAPASRRQELFVKTNGGRNIPVEVSLSPIETSKGVLIAAALRDITERKRYEESILQLAEAKSQLLQTEKMSAIGQLAAGIAHELNTPIAFVYANLGAFDGYIKDILEITAAYRANARPGDVVASAAEKDFEYLQSDIFELIAESKDGLMRMKSIVDDLRNFSRADGGEWQIVDLHKGLDSTLNIVRNELKYKCVVTKNYSNDLPLIRCFASQLNQVFMNLLVNAAHSIEGRGEIAITTRICPTDHSAIQVLIADTGSGIAQENLKRIFEPFYTTKPIGQGTGLGLSIAWGIIAKHHGTIDVSSVAGVGSTFTITLPIEQDDLISEGFPVA
ncbi:MHYT domain-containing protein [Candidatus Methylobacter oryzae]|uniref:histidine kinase n=1 Tax=Candidatus Methylobacter oryzae TaxID=2497749 RepID=A0ABY3C8Y1_9GAMM|nr:MHYT domain-containing protein [Candidatus Methylobacter oryzae]TRW93119.1 PAS domain S-box protein [Candidatus Methylobacter oryzae]